MSDASKGPGWWLASDGKWYPPHLHPSELAPPPPKSVPPSVPAPFESPAMVSGGIPPYTGWELLEAILASGLIFSLFLPWYSITIHAGSQLGTLSSGFSALDSGIGSGGWRYLIIV